MVLVAKHGFVTRCLHLRSIEEICREKFPAILIKYQRDKVQEVLIDAIFCLSIFFSISEEARAIAFSKYSFAETI